MALPSSKLSPGATIPVSRTSPGLDLTALFNAFKPLFDLLRPADVNKLATEITAVLQGEGPTINDLMEQTAKLTSHLAQKDEVIGRVITNVSTVMQTTAAHRKDLGVLISQLSKLTHGLAGDRQQIGTALDSMSHLSIAMDDLARRTRRPLTTDISRINTLTTLVNKQSDILGKGLRGTPRLLDAYARSMSYGSWLNTYICSMSIRTPSGQTLDGRTTPAATRRHASERPDERRQAADDGQHRARGRAGRARGLEAAARYDDLHRRLRQRLRDLEGRRRARGRHRGRQGDRSHRCTAAWCTWSSPPRRASRSHVRRGPRSSSPRSSDSTTWSVVPGKGDRLDGGDTIPLAQTKSAYTIDKFQVAANDAVQNIDDKALATAVDTLTHNLNGDPAATRQALQGIAQVSRTISSRDDELRRLIGSTRTVTDVVHSQQGNLMRLLGDSDKVAAMINQRRETISCCCAAPGRWCTRSPCWSATTASSCARR